RRSVLGPRLATQRGAELSQVVDRREAQRRFRLQRGEPCRGIVFLVRPTDTAHRVVRGAAERLDFTRGASGTAKQFAEERSPIVATGAHHAPIRPCYPSIEPSRAVSSPARPPTIEGPCPKTIVSGWSAASAVTLARASAASAV